MAKGNTHHTTVMGLTHITGTQLKSWIPCYPFPVTVTVTLAMFPYPLILPILLVRITLLHLVSRYKIFEADIVL